MTSRQTLVALASCMILTGCSTQTVSPALANLAGVKTEIGVNGYPIVTSITFTRPEAELPRVLKCMQAEVDGLTGFPVEIDGIARANGKAYASLQFSNHVAFSLLVHGNEYRFERLANAGINGPAYELMASKYGTPENAYSALQSVADRVSICATGRPKTS